MHTITIEIPDELYEKLQQRAQLHQRTVEEEIVAILTAAFADDGFMEQFAHGQQQTDSIEDAYN